MKEALRVHTNAEHFRTPEYAVKPLFKYMPKEWTYWEPTDTTGAISGAMLRAGYKVESTDWDFLANDCMTGWDCIITNPPFHKKDAFIEKCIWYGKPFALLLPLTALEGQKRHKMWKQIEDNFGLLCFDKRVEFTGDGVWFQTSWFTRDLLPSQIIFEHLEGDD